MNNIIKVILLFFFFSLVSFATKNNFISNEEVIFSFETQSGKIVTLSKDTSNKYIIYRFGIKNKTEFEFPLKSIDSWSNFYYSYYLRGGGTQNEGMELNYVYFTNNNFKYVIYDTYYARNEQSEIGIKVIELSTNKTTVIKGKTKTQKGTLTDLRDNNLIKKGEELFD